MEMVQQRNIKCNLPNVRGSTLGILHINTGLPEVGFVLCRGAFSHAGGKNDVSSTIT